MSRPTPVRLDDAPKHVRALTQEPLAGVPRRTGVTRFWIAIPILVAILLLLVRAWLHVDPLDRLTTVGLEPRDPPGSIARAGSIDIVRGGKVLIGFQSDADARLVVAGTEIRGHDTNVPGKAYPQPTMAPVVVPHGATAIRFAAPPGARLVWSPVGRRGDPTYVTASSLSPDPPERAAFDHPDTEIVDGIVALALLVTLVATLAILARRRLAAVSRTTWLAMAIVLVAGIAVRWIDLGGFGQTWDEDVNWASGRNYVTNLLSLDFSQRSWIWNYEHPPVMKLLDGIGAQLADGFGPARALSAIWVALGCALLVPIGSRLFRPRIGVLAAAIAALLPPLVAHGQIVGHESPTVLWWSLGIMLALGVHDYLPPRESAALRTLRIRLAWVGVAVGIAIASRFVNGLLGVLCAAIVVVQAPPRWRKETVIWGAIAMPLAAIATFVAVWPRLWPSPVDALVASLHKLDAQHAAEPFLGIVTNHPGPHYFLVYLFATLPVGILAGVIAGGVRIVRERDRRGLIAALWFVIPLGVALSPVRQDGVRYVMPSITALALIAAAGFDRIAVWARARHAFTAIAALVIVYLGITLWRVHPYYLDFFGEELGGAGGVASRGWFETAWWGEGVDRAVAYVNEHAAPNAKVYRECIDPLHLAWFREDLWAPMVRLQDQADWIVSYAPLTHRCGVPPDAHEVFRLEHDGAPMAVVYQRR